MTQWMPIQEAPKDGTTLLGYFPDREEWIEPMRMISWGYIPNIGSGWTWHLSDSDFRKMTGEPKMFLNLPAAPTSDKYGGIAVRNK